MAISTWSGPEYWEHLCHAACGGDITKLKQVKLMPADDVLYFVLCGPSLQEYIPPKKS